MSGGVKLERVAQSRLAQAGDLAAIPFSTVFSDHMLVAEFRNGAWEDPHLRPYGPLPLPPSITALQYGVSVFEGLKAHRTRDGRVAIFRPRANADRLNRSAARLAMPSLPENIFLEGLRRLVDLDRDWTPAAGKGALYIRPCMFSIDDNIRVKPAERYLFTAFTFPFGAYFAAPVNVLVCERYTRAFPGGAGDVKAAGNYAAALIADVEAREAGYDNVLWLDGREQRHVEECGVMNVFFVIDGEVVTPRLNGTILAGVTRDSIMTIARDAGLKVAERPIEIEEVFSAHERSALTEVFGTGTAAVVSQVRRIRHRDREIELPASYTIGPMLRQRLVAIATGEIDDQYGWLDYI